MPDAHARDPQPAACENCATPLQGAFCHRCGQSTHSPVRHTGHAIEEVFESFWHLDGRIFRTLRDLLVPGRVAARYLAGQRVRYVAPMRLFVILTLLTVFVAKFLVDGATLGIAADSLDRETRGRIAAATTVAEVVAVRDDVLADLDETRRVAGAIPGVRPQLDEAEALLRQQAHARIEALGGGDGAGPADGADRDDAGAGDATPVARRPGPPTIGGPLGERIERNLMRMRDDPGVFSRALLGAAPTTLFILVPLFAVLLKLFYVSQRRLYLEHVVIALYSHAALMLGLLLVFCCALAGGWLAPHAGWAAHALGWAQTLLLWSLPIYLLAMQKRVYGQSWPWTLVKFAVIGQLYLALFLSVAVPMAGYALYTA
ncbi:DUF3667 domain-containing protein [Luteimonas sp. FCS-9]|uniref:DUF3667 domain-containing protein n=1 Tax=Luteimonas sp. FCS-9 TaxID=1547516 RepID=UPI00063EA49B|nr:DUF3667 domain-containing protein [Luteimonas sp. FCS-9]KLJ00080.1 hypothetical protein WQ56_10185 [Luteimonas sp. FCS-9]